MPATPWTARTARYPDSVPDFSVILPLPTSAAENKGTAFTRLAGWARFAHSVRSMLGPGGVSGGGRIVVATAKELLGDARACLAAHGLSSVAIAVADGSGTRTQCVAAGLGYLVREAISSPFVLIHDYRRPLASADVRDRVIAQLRGGSEVVVPAPPAGGQRQSRRLGGFCHGDGRPSDPAGGAVSAGLRGRSVVAIGGRGPQESEHFDELDEAIRAGLPVTTVEGDPDAFVIEVPRDAQLVEAIISCRQDDRR